MTSNAENPVLPSLSIPTTEWTEYLVGKYGIDIGHHLELLVTDDLAGELWHQWNGGDKRIDDIGFRCAFTSLLTDAVAMGLSLDRFRDLCARLPDPGPNSAHWIGPFERAVAGSDRCAVRVSLSPVRFQRVMKPAVTDDTGNWDALQGFMRDLLFHELGILYPLIDVVQDGSLADVEVRMEWNDLKLPPWRGIGDDQALVALAPAELAATFGIVGEPVTNPANGRPHAVIDLCDMARCEEKGHQCWDSLGVTVLRLSRVLCRAAGAFVNRLLVDHYLETLRRKCPALIEETDKRLDRDLLTQVLRLLVREEVSFRDLRAILTALLSMTPTKEHVDQTHIIFDDGTCRPVFPRYGNDAGVSVTDYADQARRALGRSITHKYTRGRNTLVALQVDPNTEARLRQPLPLREPERKVLLEALKERVKTLGEGSHRVILVRQDVRWKLRAAIKHDFPELAVLGYEELSQDVKIDRREWLDAGL